MENLLGLSICALCVLCIIMMMIIKNLTREVYRNSEEAESLRSQINVLVDIVFDKDNPLLK
jgi:hypothetical protein